MSKFFAPTDVPQNMDQGPLASIVTAYAALLSQQGFTRHVLSKDFRQVRDYGFLHGKAKKLLSLVQWVLQVLIQACAPRPRPAFLCPVCQAPMKILSIGRSVWSSA
jgi:hypothetical protein